MEFTLTLPQFINLMLFPWFAAGVIWFVKNRKRIMDKFNLTFRRARVVKVNFQTRSGRNIERYLVPDARGVILIDEGKYIFNKDLAVINAKYRIPEINFIEGQIHANYPAIALAGEVEMEIVIANPDGTKKTEKRKVPTYVLDYRKTSPEKLKGLTSQELKEALDSKIVRDIIRSTVAELNHIPIILYCVIALLAITIIGDVAIYNKIGKLGVALDYAIKLLTRSGA